MALGSDGDGISSGSADEDVAEAILVAGVVAVLVLCFAGAAFIMFRRWKCSRSQGLAERQDEPELQSMDTGVRMLEAMAHSMVDSQESIPSICTVPASNAVSTSFLIEGFPPPGSSGEPVAWERNQQELIVTII